MSFLFQNDGANGPLEERYDGLMVLRIYAAQYVLCCIACYHVFRYKRVLVVRSIQGSHLGASFRT